MRIEQLKQVRVLEETLSISQAAKQLYMTPAALSMSLTNLENELGIKLFERCPSGIRPTAAERAISGMIQSILQDIEQLEQLPKRTMAERNTIALATTSALYDEMVLYLSYHITQKPAIPLDIFPETIPRILDSLAIGQCDMALIHCIDDRWQTIEQQLKTDHLSHELLQSAPFQLCLPPDHPLSAHQSIAPNDIGQEKIFLLRDHTLFLPKSHLLDKIHRSQWMAVDDLETLKRLAIAEQGIGIAPHFCLMHDPYFTQGSLMVKDLRSTKMVSYHLLYNRHRCQSPTKQQLLADLHQWQIHLAE